MDACHILLGRSWQFYRNTINDGHENTYSLTKDGVQHKMQPLKEIEEKVCCNTINCLVDEITFLEGITHEKMCFYLISKYGKKEVEDLPIEVVSLLDEFKDIVSNNVVDGFSLRNISHQMDLILGADFQISFLIE